MKKAIRLLVLATMLAVVFTMLTAPATALAAEEAVPPGGGSWQMTPPGGDSEFKPPANPPNPTEPAAPPSGGSAQKGQDVTNPVAPDPVKPEGPRTELPKTGGDYQIYILLGLSMMALGSLGTVGYGRLVRVTER